MAEILNPRLTLTTTNDKVTAVVTYDAKFTSFERWLKVEGNLDIHAHITLHGWDGPSNPVGAAILAADFGRPDFDDLTLGSGTQTVPRRHELEVDRDDLNEDTTPDADDEIVANIRIHFPIPPVFTDDLFTDDVVLQD